MDINLETVADTKVIRGGETLETRWRIDCNGPWSRSGSSTSKLCKSLYRQSVIINFICLFLFFLVFLMVEGLKAKSS